MSVHMVQAKIERERVTDVQAAAKRMFAAIDVAQPEGIRYASCLLPDGETFIALLQVDDGVSNPLPGLPEFREFLEGAGDFGVVLMTELRGASNAKAKRELAWHPAHPSWRQGFAAA